MKSSRRSNRWHALLGTKGDRLLLLLVLLALALIWRQVYAAEGPAVVRIYHGSELLAVYPLTGGKAKPRHIHLAGDIGEAEIVIDDQGARFARSPCPLQRCVHSGSAQKPGEVIACVPNRLLLAVDGAEAALDAIVE